MAVAIDFPRLSLQERSGRGNPRSVGLAFPWIGKVIVGVEGSPDPGTLGWISVQQDWLNALSFTLELCPNTHTA